MKRKNLKLKNILISIRVGAFLAIRQMKHSSRWTNVLVTFIMTLTFLNLVVVSGILVGLIEGVSEAVRTYYIGDIFISNLKQKTYIEQSPSIIKTAESLPQVEKLTARYLEIGTIEANYKKNKKETELDETVGTAIAGIDPKAENEVTNLSKLVIEGSYLNDNDFDQIMVGAMLLRQYLDFESPNFPLLENVRIGSKVRIAVGDNTREVTVKGIIRSKVDEIDRRVFFVDKQFRGIIGRVDYNVDEIVLHLRPNANPIAVKQALLQNGFGAYAKIQTQEDAEPKFVKDMKQTFAMLGNMISSIGLAVAIITIFIVIFINAITRRKFIGILKGIGIHSLAIECAYVFQSTFYAILGTAFGLLIVYGFLEPYIRKHPINFPFSDGILVVPLDGTIIKIAILLVATIIAGYIPARIVTKQNTLDAILNR